jgi:hypothetical protein
MKMTDNTDFAKLATDELHAMREAGAYVRECYRVLAKTGDNIVGELIKGEEAFYEWNHYPEGDVYDQETHSQYYYHAHPAEERPGEHGHFHTFIRPGGMPADIHPAPVPDFTPPENADDALSHIIAISMDRKGFPIKLFTTNRWVTGEIWYSATDVCRLLPLFDVDHAQPSWPVNIWITNMLALFRPQIRVLIHARDRTVAEWARSHPDEDIFEDRALEVTTEMAIDVDKQLASVEKVLAARDRG